MLSIIMLTGCTASDRNQICIGGTTTPSEACLLIDSALAGSVGAVVGAHALNHDPYDKVKDLIWGDGGMDGGR